MFCCGILLHIIYFHFLFTISHANFFVNILKLTFLKLFFRSLVHCTFLPVWSLSGTLKFMLKIGAVSSVNIILKYTPIYAPCVVHLKHRMIIVLVFHIWSTLVFPVVWFLCTNLQCLVIPLTCHLQLLSAYDT